MTTAPLLLLDAQQSARLDALLSAVAQRYSDTLPAISPHLAHDGNTDTTAVHKMTPAEQQQQQQQSCTHDSDSSSDDDGDGDDDAACRARARAVCVGCVPGLSSWQARVSRLRDEGASCARALHTLHEQLARMHAVTAAVHAQSEALGQSASALLLRETRLEQVQEGLQRTLAHFTRVQDLCHEAEHSPLAASSRRLPALLQEMREEMAYLAEHAAYKSARVYAMRLSQAMQRVLSCLTTAMTSSFAAAQRVAAQSPAYAHALLPQLPQTLLLTDGSGGSSAANNNNNSSSNDKSKSRMTEATPAALWSYTATADAGGAASGEAGVRDMTRRFADVLCDVNETFVAALRPSAPLRRLLECSSSSSGGDGGSDDRSGSMRGLLSSYTGAQAFGEDSSLDVGSSGGVHMRSILAAYCDARVALMVPLLRAWLSVYSSDDSDAVDHDDTTTTTTMSSLSTANNNNNNNNNSKSIDANNTTTMQAHSSHVGVTAQQPTNDDNDRDTADESVAATTTTTMTAAPQPPLTQRVCALLEVVIASERAVVERVWLRDDVAEALLPRIVARTSDSVYCVFRAHLLRMDDVVDLAATVTHIQAVWLRQCSNSSNSNNTMIDNNNDDTATRTAAATTAATAAAADMYDMSELWLRMIQDAQERLIFRASVYLRHQVARCHPTRDEVARYVQLEPVAIVSDEDSDDTTRTTAAGATTTPSSSSSSFVLLPGVCSAMQLLHYLYTSLEFAVFAVFAEEAVATSMSLIRELVAAMTATTAAAAAGSSGAAARRADGRHTRLRALLCQLLHLYYLHDELARIDANITVVERRLDLSRLRQRRLSIVQSTREAKQEVNAALQTCREQVVQEMLSLVSAPLTGAAHKAPAAVRAALDEAHTALTQCEALLYTYLRERVNLAGAAVLLTHGPQQQQQQQLLVQQLVQSLLQPVQQRVTELRLEVAADEHSGSSVATHAA